MILAPQSVWAFIDPASLAYRTLVEPGHQSRIFLVKRRGWLMPPAAARFLGVCGGVLRSEGMKTARKGNLSWLEGSFTYVKGIMEINTLPLPLGRWRGAAY